MDKNNINESLDSEQEDFIVSEDSFKNSSNKKTGKKIDFDKIKILAKEKIEQVKVKIKENQEKKKEEKKNEKSELELFNRLSTDEKAIYKERKKNILQIQFGIGIIILISSISYGSTEFFKNELKKSITNNIELEDNAKKVLKEIKKAAKSDLLTGKRDVETLLQEVTLNGKIAKKIYNSRDELLDALPVLEKLLPKDKRIFSLKGIKRTGPNIYSVEATFKKRTYDGVKEGGEAKDISRNKALEKVAMLVETFDKSQQILIEKMIDEKRALIKEKTGYIIKGEEQKEFRKKIEFFNGLTTRKEFDKYLEKLNRTINGKFTFEDIRLTKIPSYFKLVKFAGTSYIESEKAYSVSLVLEFVDERKKERIKAEEEEKKLKRKEKKNKAKATF